MSEQRRAGLAGLRAARKELVVISRLDRCDSDAYLAANARVIAAERRLPGGSASTSI